MMRIALAMAAAAVVSTVGSPVGGGIPAKAENLKMAQVEIQVGPRDRDVREERSRRDRGQPGVTFGVGPREHCRMVTTTVENDDGRKVTRREQVCD